MDQDIQMEIDREAQSDIFSQLVDTYTDKTFRYLASAAQLRQLEMRDPLRDTLVTHEDQMGAQITYVYAMGNIGFTIVRNVMGRQYGSLSPREGHNVKTLTDLGAQSVSRLADKCRIERRSRYNPLLERLGLECYSNDEPASYTNLPGEQRGVVVQRLSTKNDGVVKPDIIGDIASQAVRHSFVLELVAEEINLAQRLGTR